MQKVITIGPIRLFLFVNLISTLNIYKLMKEWLGNPENHYNLIATIQKFTLQRYYMVFIRFAVVWRFVIFIWIPRCFK